MDLVLENLRHIEMGNAREVLHDPRFVLYVVPTEDVSYEALYGKITEKFNVFYDYAIGYKVDEVERGFRAVATYLVNKIKNAPMGELIAGYRKMQDLVEAERRTGQRGPGRAKKLRARIEQRKRKGAGVYDEREIEQMHLECSMYMGEAVPANFYRASYMLAEYHLERGNFEMARGYAREALEVSGRTSAPSGVKDCRALLEKISERDKQLSARPVHMRQLKLKGGIF